MDVRACIATKPQNKSVELRRESISENVYRRLEVNVGEQKNASKMTKLYENSVFPRFEIRPTDTYIVANQTGTILAHISGTSATKPVIKWYKNGQLITGSLYPRMKKHHCVSNIYIFEIENAIADDMGSYTCVARNCYGRITASANVRIIDLEVEEFPRLYSVK